MAWWARVRSRLARVGSGQRAGVGRLRRGSGRGAGTASGSAGPTREEVQQALGHLRDFVATRRGVEMYVEPRTSMTPTTVVLIATTGEWTRRRVSDPAAAWALGRDLGVPVYDTQQVGYPPRMRAWTAAQRRRDG